MHIKEFSAMTGLSQSKIRFYEKQGLLQTDRQRNGYRDFTPEDAFRSNAFRSLLKYGFSVEDAICMIDEQQQTEAFADSLRDRRAEMEREIELLHYRMQRIDHALDHIEHDPDESFELTDAPDYLFVRASYGRDFSIAQQNEQAIADYYDLLSVTTCARIIPKSQMEAENPAIDPSYIIAVQEPDALKLPPSTLKASDRICLGKCIRYRRAATREESNDRASFASLQAYLDEHGYRIRDDILLIPLFLNLDGRGRDIEILFVPVA